MCCTLSSLVPLQIGLIFTLRFELFFLPICFLNERASSGSTCCGECALLSSLEQMIGLFLCLCFLYACQFFALLPIPWPIAHQMAFVVHSSQFAAMLCAPVPRTQWQCVLQTLFSQGVCSNCNPYLLLPCSSSAHLHNEKNIHSRMCNECVFMYTFPLPRFTAVEGHS